MRVDFAKELADALGISTAKVTAAFDKLHQGREKRFDKRAIPGDMPPPPARMGFHFGVPSGQLASELGVTRSELRKALGEVEQGLDAAEEQARRSWVEPGKLREARSRTVFGKRDWDDIQRAARQVGR